MKYLKKYTSNQEYNTNKDLVPVPNICYVKEGTIVDEVKWRDSDYFKYEYLTTTALTDGTITFTMYAALTVANCTRVAYSLDDGQTWTITNNVASTAVPVTVNVTAGQKVLWKGKAVRYDTVTSATSCTSKFSSTAEFNISGNILSMLYEDDFASKTTTGNSQAFAGFFQGCTNLINAQNLVLSATTLKNYDYMAMFRNCSSLMSTPKLPATTVPLTAYANMFQNCTSLTETPVLNATTLTGNYTYSAMFAGCTALTKINKITTPTTLNGNYVMASMFSGCTSLTHIHTPITLNVPNTTKTYSYQSMFNGCTSLVDISNITIGNLGSYGCNLMFKGCTKLQIGPIFNGTSVGSYGCANMFESCTSLVNAPELPYTSLGTFCYSYMFTLCTKLLNGPTTLPAPTLTSNCYQYMFNGCTVLNNPPTLPALNLAPSCYYYMFQNCKGLVNNAPALPATTLSENCYCCMFTSCTSLKTAPDLLATTLVEGCYWSMFYGCTALTYVKMLGLNIDSAPKTTLTWMYGINPTGAISSSTMVINSAATWYERGKSGIPVGWNIQYDGNSTVAQTTMNNFISSHTEAAATPYYLKTKALTSGTITFTIGKSVQATSHLKYIEYSINGGVSWERTTNTNNVAKVITTPVLSANDEVLWRGECYSLNTTSGVSANVSANNFSNFSSTCDFAVSGNILSLLDPLLQYNKMTTYVTDYGFAKLFSGATHLISAENLTIPDGIRNYGCSHMFDGCTSLTTAPALPATILGNYCYQYMFQNCSSLTVAPTTLPATYVPTYGYYYMFSGCTSLVNAPSFGATSMGTYCHARMFYGCTSLVNIPSILPATILQLGCYDYMFYGCSNITTAPILPATAGVNYCYRYMFANCSKLNYIKCMLSVTGTPSSNHIGNWVNGVAASGTFVKNTSSTKWTATGVSSIPVGWTVQTATS